MKNSEPREMKNKQDELKLLQHCLYPISRPLSGEKAVLSATSTGKTDIHTQKKEAGLLRFTIYKNKLKMAQMS